MMRHYSPAIRFCTQWLKGQYKPNPVLRSSSTVNSSNYSNPPNSMPRSLMARKQKAASLSSSTSWIFVQIRS